MAKKRVDSWVISGREAEVLHLEEEDFSDPEKGSEEEEDEDDDPIKKIIQSRYYFSPHLTLFFQIELSCTPCIIVIIVMPSNTKHLLFLSSTVQC